MARLLRLLCLIAVASAQLDFEDDDSDTILDNSLARDIEDSIFGSDKRTITIFSNFDNPTDQFFFQNVLPWLVDNIGNYLRIIYRFGNSARRSGPRACALRALRTNTYAQAEFLRCESRGNPVSTCLDQAPIDRRQYNRCLNRNVNDYVRQSQWEFETLISQQTPIVLVGGRREVLTNDPMQLLRLICQRYGRTKPSRCLRPVTLPRAISGRSVPSQIKNLAPPDTIESPVSPIQANPTNIVAVTEYRNQSEQAVEPSNSIPYPQSDMQSSAFHQAVPFQLSLHLIIPTILSYLKDSFL